MKKNYFRYEKYQMRSADYELMLKDQKHVCAICGGPQSGKLKRLCIDHDHNTLDVRGLLCTSCNLLLGYAKDDPAVLQAALEYIKSGGHPSRFYVEGGKLIELEEPGVD